MTFKFRAFRVCLLAAVLLVGCGFQSSPPSTIVPLPTSTTESAMASITTTPVATTDTATALPASPSTTATAISEFTASPMTSTQPPLTEPTLQEYSVPPGSHPHDVAPAPDGSVWYTVQGAGKLGRLNPTTGQTHHIPLGVSSAPHGIIIGPDEAPWITDGGLNVIVRVGPVTETVQTFPLFAGTGYANLNTATFDGQGTLWFTEQKRSLRPSLPSCWAGRNIYRPRWAWAIWHRYHTRR